MEWESGVHVTLRSNTHECERAWVGIAIDLFGENGSVGQFKGLMKNLVQWQLLAQVAIALTTCSCRVSMCES